MFLLVLMALVGVGCSTSKFVPEGEHLLSSARVMADDKDFPAASLVPYIRQHDNSKWFSSIKVPLLVYGLAGRDTTKWLNRTLQNIGEAPVVFDSAAARLTCRDLQAAAQSLGYMDAQVDLLTRTKGRKLKALYYIRAGRRYNIGRVSYEFHDPSIARLIDSIDNPSLRLQEGMPFTMEALENERKRMTTLLTSNGYYRFNKDYIHYTADSLRKAGEIDLGLIVEPYRTTHRDDDATGTELHPRYYVRNVRFICPDSANNRLRHSVLERNTAITAGQPFNSQDLQKTYNNFGRLQAVRYTNIGFREVADSLLLDCDILVNMNKPRSIVFQPEGTNTAGDLGAAASLTYANRNLFHGSEVLSVELRAAFEAITGLEGYQNQDYEEYSVETKLMFPRFVAPFLSRSFRKRSSATSELLLSYDLQNRPEFHRRLFSAAWRYRWSEPKHHTSYRLDLIDLNYILMPWISATFKHDYLDSVSNRNAILRYNYEDLFIMKTGFGVTYNNGTHAIRANVETAGNLLHGLSSLFGSEPNSNDQYTLFSIAYAQYAKFDFDYTRLLQFDEHNQLALHGRFGIAYPYGNSRVLPFEKRYFSGGANSVRGWSVRGLGPGKFKGTDGRIDFINQTGDMKLDLNLEYRTLLFWKLGGAAFIDAGNIWTLREYEEQPGGQFKLNEFYKQIAVSYGLGLRLNFDYFILRFDMGMKAINPAYETKEEHYALLHPKFSRDFAFHFAVGLPF